jgi:hypothetical protein
MARSLVMRGRIMLCAGLLVLSNGLAAGAARAQSDAPEYAVKAAYLYKLGDYVEWPAATFAAPASPLTICVSGDDPFGAALDGSVAGQKVAGRAIQVRRLAVAERDSGCQVLYIAGSEGQPVAAALAAVRGAPILTVTDAGRGSAKGIVHFVVQERRVRFEIDDQSAATNGLKISSKLFALALSVKPRS